MEIDSFDTLHQATLLPISKCRKELLIFSRAMEPKIFEKEDVLESIKQLAIQNHQVQIRLLVLHSHDMVSGNHRLNALIERLSSKIALRVPATTDQDFAGAFIVVDAAHCLLQNNGSLPDAELHLDERRLASKWSRIFMQMWEKAKPDPNFRRLGI